MMPPDVRKDPKVRSLIALGVLTEAQLDQQWDECRVLAERILAGELTIEEAKTASREAAVALVEENMKGNAK